MTDTTDNRRSNGRLEESVPVEFIVAEDIVHALSIDLSDTGIQFETDRALQIELRCMVGGEMVERRARMVWLRTDDEGHCKCGFEFLPEESF